MPTMNQMDINRQKHLARLPEAIVIAGDRWHRALERQAVATKAGNAADEQHPEFTSPTSMQRVGYYMRLSVYPANFLAELTAGAATAMYIAKALLGLSDEYRWFAALCLATIALAAEVAVAHAREEDRDEQGRAPAGWTAAALVILIVLVGSQITSQVVDALKPVTAGSPPRTVSDLEWFEWARVAFFCALLGILHVIVLFGGESQERALAYGLFRSNRRITSARAHQQDVAQLSAMAEFSRLVTAYNVHRNTHIARGFDAGPQPAFDAVTLSMLRRIAQPSSSGAATGSSEERSVPKVAPQPTAPTTSARPSSPPPGPDDTPARGSAASDLENENAYLRSILDARTRNDDGEVRPVAAKE